KQSLMLVSGHLRAVGYALDDRAKQVGMISRLRLSLALVVGDVLTAEEVCSRITAERLDGQDVLFPDARQEMSEQIHTAKLLSDCFNQRVGDAGEAAIDWEQIRTSIQPVVDQQVAAWVDSARMSM